ncbi:V-set domain-containing T-cell activation inhibitor 1-like [Astatotilapia calliptera]|uniref:Ig-like domain-containing protein n=2 Tax=Astatotilapia calliptera TaxID=8154 RepID=A0A3P8PUF2_ASTCA|nr:V-set domain-containing T-cell activation inhibitor 1-like [Astatotilapia calliptera]
MAGNKCAVFLVLLTFTRTLTGGDTDVSCIFMETCMLPCSSEGGTAVIHWFQQSAGNRFVHSFYEGKDQLGLQNQRFRGRTSLFSDQISSGNASLLLTKVEVQDEGRYKCYTSTENGIKESFINLKMDAPVHEVDIQREGNTLTCCSEGIYPEPKLTWSTSPPSNVNSKCNTRMQETEQHLYNISSSVTPSDSETDLTFSCTISTRRSKRSVTWPSTSSKQSNSGATVAGVIAAIVITGVVAAVGFVLYKRRKSNTNKTHTDTELKVELNRSSATKHLTSPKQTPAALLQPCTEPS